jgi:hypothetical protein
MMNNAVVGCKQDVMARVDDRREFRAAAPARFNMLRCVAWVSTEDSRGYPLPFAQPSSLRSSS